MKLETSERILVETLVNESVDGGKLSHAGKFKISKLTGDASTRRYYRVLFDLHAYVVCLDTPREEHQGDSDFIRVLRTLENSGVRVPKVFDQDSERGYYLEEDLGDQTFLRELSSCQSREEELALYNKALDLLLGLHRVNLNEYPNEVYNQRAFDMEKLMFEMNFTLQQFIEGLMGYAQNGYPKAAMLQDLESICREVSEGPWVFTHRDYHSRNIMVKDGELVVIDFQDARKGVPQYDLASLLEDCYYELSSENHNILLQRYWNEFGKEVWNGDEADFMRKYRLMAIQRIFKAIGSFAYIYRLRADIRYLRHIGRAFERLKAILFELNEYHTLKKQLAGLYYAY